MIASSMSSIFVQSDRIRDYVFPLCLGKRSNTGIEFTQFLGTAFLIGGNSWALTASHVVSNIENVFAMFVDDEHNHWLGFEIESLESHPTDDVAIFRISNVVLHSFISISSANENAGTKYMQFGYPDDMMYELSEKGRPDLIYCEGYIRRRTNHKIPSFKGRSFFELSEICGQGCSGSPLFSVTQLNPKWQVVGIYVGEKINDRGTSVSYAVRTQCFKDWFPQALGHSIFSETSS